MVETGSAHDETSSSGNKEDEDDEDDESDERIDTHSHHDPERLKAFNVSIQSNPSISSYTYLFLNILCRCLSVYSSTKI